MSQEIGPLTISGRQLLMNTQPKANEWTEIGEAKITTTIFGSARVSIVRKHDKMRRAMFLMALLVTSVLAGVVWVMLHPTEPPQRIEFLPPISANGETNVQISPSVVDPVSVVSPPVKEAPPSFNNQKNTEAKPSPSNLLHKPPQATAIVAPRIAHPVVSGQAALASSNKVEASKPPEREILSVDPLKEKQ